MEGSLLCWTKFLTLPDLVRLIRTSKYFNANIRNLPIDYFDFGDDYSDSGLEIIRIFPNLKALHIDVSCDQFSKLSNLTRLRINSTMDLDHYLKLLPNRDKLKLLAIDCLNQRADELYDGEDLAVVVPELDTLHVRHRDFPDQFFWNFRNLTELCLVWCNNITTEVFRDLSNLERLYMRNTNIGDDAFRHIPNLKLLHFEHCDNITDAAFENLTCLESLTISYISLDQEISDKAFQYLTNLTELCLQPNYDDEPCNFSLEIFKYLPKLKRLDLHGSKLITPELFQALYMRLDWLDIRRNLYQEPLQIPIQMVENIFLNLHIKVLYIDRLFPFPTKSVLNCLIKNGLEELSVIRCSEFSGSRFSKKIYTKKKTFFGKNILNYLRWIKSKYTYAEIQSLLI
jgi:hypothetical protein